MITEIKESIQRGVRDLIVKYEDQIMIVCFMYVLPGLIALPFFYLRYIK